MARDVRNLADLNIATQDLAIDLMDEKSIEDAVSVLPEKSEIDLIFVATGWLHDDEHQPEKSFRSLSAEQLNKSYQINTFGPALLIKCLLARLNPKHPVALAVLTARVGSISDNRLGGWYSYRSSKAALNMLLKNFAIECTRLKRSIVIVGLQPGTTDTKLSEPFQRGVLPENLQTVEYTASQLIKVMFALEPKDSGLLFDFLGLPFNP
jgi:NAD(P)-dependent dehydrogenase (short-subunit alcohol dehydrogenase family)